MASVIYSGTIIRNASDSGTTTKSFTIPSGNSNVVLLVFGHGCGAAGAWSISAADYNGDALTQKWEAQHDTYWTNFCYYKTTPDAGSSYTLTINHTNGRMQASILVLEGVDISGTLFGTVASGTSVSLNVSGAANDYVIDCVLNIDGSVTFGAVGAGQTQLLNAGISAYGASAQSYEVASGATTTMSWGTDPSGSDYHRGVAVKALAVTNTTNFFRMF